jgi:hypothetical protein
VEKSTVLIEEYLHTIHNFVWFTYPLTCKTSCRPHNIWNCMKYVETCIRRSILFYLDTDPLFVRHITVINVPKTKAIAMKGKMNESNGIMIFNNTIEQVNNFNYLGYTITFYLLAYGAEPFLRSCQLCSHSENSQQIKGTRRFITVFTRTLHWYLSWASSIQSLPSHPIYLEGYNHIKKQISDIVSFFPILHVLHLSL